MKSLPFRLRIALLSAAISGVVLLVFGTMAWYMIYRERLAALDREIRTLAYRHPGWMGTRANYERLSSVIELIYGEDHKEQLILWATDTNGNTRYISPHWPKDLEPKTLDLRLADNPHPASSSGESREEALTSNRLPVLPPRGPPWAMDHEPGSGPGRGFGRMRGPMAPLVLSKTPRFETVKLASSTWRLGVLGNNGDRLVIGLNSAGIQAELDRMRKAFLAALPIALLLVGGGGWWIAGRAMIPLRSIARIAEHVTAQGLDQRIPVTTEDREITRLINVLNGMMDRLEKSFHQATRFSADASHELKTPLAVMQGELENALQLTTPGSKEQQILANLLEETQRLKTITRGLLLLAQADAGRLSLVLKPVNLSRQLRELSEDIEALAVEAQLRLELQILPDISVQADWSLLRQAVLNLLTNAIRYNEPHGHVSLQLEVQDNSVKLKVSNSGPGIPPADQPKLFDRFYRVDTARSRQVEGVGLGLSLAREITRAHGGDLVLQESRPGHTCFVLILPTFRSPVKME